MFTNFHNLSGLVELINTLELPPPLPSGLSNNTCWFPVSPLSPSLCLSLPSPLSPLISLSLTLFSPSFLFYFSSALYLSLSPFLSPSLGQPLAPASIQRMASVPVTRGSHYPSVSVCSSRHSFHSYSVHTVQCSPYSCCMYVCTCWISATDMYEARYLGIVSAYTILHVQARVHTCHLPRDIQQICCSTQTGQHSPLQGSCCPVWALQHIHIG